MPLTYTSNTDTHLCLPSPQTCIELREKYIRLSCQRLEDNPANYDGEFAPPKNSTSAATSRPPSPERATFSNRKKDANEGGDKAAPGPSAGESKEAPAFSKWTIYPPPPAPHWESKAKSSDPDIEPAREFRMEDCEIPGEHPFVFELDKQGIFQVYESAETGKPDELLLFPCACR